VSLSQNEVDHLLRLKKKFQDDAAIDLGPHPIEWSRNIISIESKDAFILDYRRASIELKKYTLNKRYRTAIVLLRYDSIGRHTNPPGTDEKKFDGPHVHLFREGYDDKWAFPISVLGLNSDPTIVDVLGKLLDYCNVIERPQFADALF
jgi:hypothetical protein